MQANQSAERIPDSGVARRAAALATAAAIVLAAAGPPRAWAASVPFSATTTIAAGFNGATAVHAADVDGDGDLDVLGAARVADDVAWWENTAGDASTWAAHTIDGSFGGARSVDAADLDGDGDADVLSASFDSDRITWWENTAGDGSVWSAHVVASGFTGASAAYAADVDGDGDLDVLGAASLAGSISWWENTAGDGSTWVKHRVEAALLGARSVHAADVDGDGDLDVLAAADAVNDVAWWENAAGDGSVWSRHMIANSYSPTAVYAADIDRDGDVDVLTASGFNDAVFWWENAGGNGRAWTRHIIDTNFERGKSVFVADLDGDGDLDALGAAELGDEVSWWENTSGDGRAWDAHVLAASYDGAFGAYAADLDGDGNLDVLGAARLADTVSWWRNETIHRSATFPIEHTIDGTFDGAGAVHSADVDGDGDLDVLGAAFTADHLIWWENAAGAWTAHTIDAAFDGATAVHTADVDGDGDLDVVGAAFNVDEVAWWENTARDGTAWTKHTVDGAVGGARSVHAVDVDGDGDIDILGAAEVADDIVWWENTTGEGSAWSKHAIDANFNGACAVYAADVDGDGDVDVLGAAIVAADVAWWENTAGDGSAWSDHTINANFDEAHAVYAADVDGDGDVDVLGAAFLHDDVTWWENTAGDGSVWSGHVIDGNFNGAWAVYAADLDQDGDVDVLAAAGLADDVTWWENTAGDGGTWRARTIDGNFDGAHAVAAADVDGDGDLDVLGAAFNADDLTWWENRGGQFGLATVDGAPATLAPGAIAPVLTITQAHRGRSGDSDVELATLELRLDDGTGTVLSNAQADAVIDDLYVYRDDGSGSFEAGSEIQVAAVSAFSLDAGVQTVSFADGNSHVQTGYGVDATYFVVVATASGGGFAVPNTFRVTHVTEASSTAEDASADIPLALEYAANVSSRTVALIECGNGIVEAGEQCDDGGAPVRGCCSATCRFEDSGNACGSSADGECTAPDTCDGAGTCLDNDQPAGTACGDQGVECLVGDACDGAGTCVDNGFAPPGTSCGSDVTGECDAADTCDGSGACLDNYAAADTPCGDQGVECLVDDTCDGAGACTDNGFAPSGASCGSSAAGECDAPDTCDGGGTCLANSAAPGTACGDAADSGCDDPDTCDGGGVCQDNAVAGICTETDVLLSYKVRSPRVDLGGLAIPANDFPKDWVITVNDWLLDDQDADDPENFVVTKARELYNPAAADGAATPLDAALHYLRYDMKLGAESVQAPGGDGNIPRPAKHGRRLWRLDNGLGEIAVVSNKVKGFLLPAAAAVDATPAPPGAATHYACYQVKVAKSEYGGQTPGQCDRQAPANAQGACTGDADCGGTVGELTLCQKPKFRRDLQVFVNDPLFGDCAVPADGSTPSFAGTAVEGTCLLDLKKPVELCNPVETGAVEPPRESSAVFDPSQPSSTRSLLCYKAKPARKIVYQPAAALAQSVVGAKIEPKQAGHTPRTLAAGSEVHTAPGSRFPGPTVIETTRLGVVCLPSDVLAVEEE